MADIVVTPDQKSSGDSKEFRSGASSLSPWAGQELRWAGTVFAKIAVTIALTRALTRFLGVPIPRLFEKAQDLSEFGRKKKPYSDPGSSGGSSSSSSSFMGGAGSSSGGSTFSRKAEAPPFQSRNGEFSRFVKRVSGYDLTHHGHVFEGHLWPCPIASRQECRDCRWFVTPGGVAHCVALEKLKQVLSGHDDGSDLYELRDRLVSL